MSTSPARESVGPSSCKESQFDPGRAHFHFFHLSSSLTFFSLSNPALYVDVVALCSRRDVCPDSATSSHERGPEIAISCLFYVKKEKRHPWNLRVSRPWWLSTIGPALPGNIKPMEHCNRECCALKVAVSSSIHLRVRGQHMQGLRIFWTLSTGLNFV